MPHISVIIPTYNRRAMVVEAIESVLAQTYKNFEVIVVDDGSTDGTGEEIRKRFGHDPRVRYFWQENQERARARNRGIREARGEFLAFLDSDDCWLPHKLERQVPLLTANPEVVMVHCAAGFSSDGRTFAEHSTLESREGINQGRIFRAMVYANQIMSPTPLVRRKAIERAGLFSEDRRLLAFEDWLCWTRVAYGGSVAFLPECLAVHRVHEGNTERPLTPAVYSVFVRDILRAVASRDGEMVKAAAADRFVELGAALAVQGRPLAALGALMAGMRAVGGHTIWRSNPRLVAQILFSRTGAELLRRAHRLANRSLTTQRPLEGPSSRK